MDQKIKAQCANRQELHDPQQEHTSVSQKEWRKQTKWRTHYPCASHLSSMRGYRMSGRNLNTIPLTWCGIHCNQYHLSRLRYFIGFKSQSLASRQETLHHWLILRRHQEWWWKVGDLKSRNSRKNTMKLINVNIDQHKFSTPGKHGNNFFQPFWDICPLVSSYQ